MMKMWTDGTLELGLRNIRQGGLFLLLLLLLPKKTGPVNAIVASLLPPAGTSGTPCSMPCQVVPVQ